MEAIIVQEKWKAKMMHIIWKLSLSVIAIRMREKTDLEKQIIINAIVWEIKKNPFIFVQLYKQ